MCVRVYSSINERERERERVCSFASKQVPGKQDEGEKEREHGRVHSHLGSAGEEGRFARDGPLHFPHAVSERANKERGPTDER